MQRTRNVGPREVSGHPSHVTWTSLWENFLAKHRDWWEKQSGNGAPVYRLDQSVIDSLAYSWQAPSGEGYRRLRYLTVGEEESEKAFTELCQHWDDCVVGFTPCGEPIRYEFLDPSVAEWRPPRQSASEKADEFSELAGRKNDSGSGVDQTGRNAEKVIARLRSNELAVQQSQMVHVAWLIQQPEYWGDLNELQGHWLVGRGKIRFRDLCGRVAPLATQAIVSRDREHYSAAAGKFFDDLWQFARRWNIAAFKTWHLPLPQLALVNESADMLLCHRLSTNLADAIPGYLPLSRLFGDQKVVWQLPTPDPRPRLANRTLQQGPTVCRQNEVPSYALILRLHLEEIAVRSRFDSAGLPHGVRGRMLDGLAESLGKDREHLKRNCQRFRAAFTSNK